MKKIIAGLLILVSLSVYAKDDYVLCKASSDRVSSLFYSKKIIKSINYKYNNTYLVWVKEVEIGDGKKSTIKTLNNFFRWKKLKCVNANNFSYTIQLYLIDIDLYKIKLISDKVFYDVKGNGILSEDSDSGGTDWLYITPRSKIYGLISDIKKYIHK